MKRILAAGIFLVLFACLAFAQSPEQLYEQANSLYQQGKAADHVSRSRVAVTKAVGEIPQRLVLLRGQTVETMPRLRTMSELPAYWTEINRLENAADDVHRGFLGDLFGNGTDAIEVLKTKEVADALEAAADAFETVANTVETIAVKES